MSLCSYKRVQKSIWRGIKKIKHVTNTYIFRCGSSLWTGFVTVEQLTGTSLYHQLASDICDISVPLSTLHSLYFSWLLTEKKIMGIATCELDV